MKKLLSLLMVCTIIFGVMAPSTSVEAKKKETVLTKVYKFTIYDEPEEVLYGFTYERDVHGYEVVELEYTGKYDGKFCYIRMIKIIL